MNKKTRRVPDRLCDIWEALENVKSDLGTMTKEQFLADGKTQRAVIEGLIVIGEAANSIMQLDPELEQKHPGAWRQFRDVYGMRIILTHEYFRVDAAVVWDTIQNDLPELERLMERLSPPDLTHVCRPSQKHSSYQTDATKKAREWHYIRVEAGSDGQFLNTSGLMSEA